MANIALDRVRAAPARRRAVPRADRVQEADGDEAELGQRFRDGQPDAMDELHARFSRPLLTVARRHLSDPALAADAVQQTLLQAWRGAAGFDPDRELGPWLFQICRRVCIDMLRRRREPTASVDGHGQHPSLAVDGPSLDDTWRAVQVRRAIDGLPPDTRTIVRLIYLDGWTLPQTAELLGVPLGTVKSRSFRAHRQLTTLLAHVHTPDGATAA